MRMKAHMILDLVSAFNSLMETWLLFLSNVESWIKKIISDRKRIVVISFIISSMSARVIGTAQTFFSNWYSFYCAIYRPSTCNFLILSLGFVFFLCSFFLRSIYVRLHVNGNGFHFSIRFLSKYRKQVFIHFHWIPLNQNICLTFFEMTIAIKSSFFLLLLPILCLVSIQVIVFCYS